MAHARDDIGEAHGEGSGFKNQEKIGETNFGILRIHSR
jgi:hypothetical protein